VMSAYNSVNGEWCGHNRALLTDILREEWGFEGFVISDWVFGGRDAAPSLTAGLEPARDLLIEACNFGYAKSCCPFWPGASNGDALRFSLRKSDSPASEIVWIRERDHIPQEFGTLVYSQERGLEPPPADPILARQAALFAQRYADA